MQVGDLVRKQVDLGQGSAMTLIGLIVDFDENSIANDDYFKVLWSGDYGSFWTPEHALEIVSNV